MPTTDELKAARDGHLGYGPYVPPPRPVGTVSIDTYGHKFHSIPGMATVEYASDNCRCPSCKPVIREAQG